MSFDKPLPKIILVPTDFSHCADHALAYAFRMATALSAELCLLHVTELTAGIEPTMTLRPDGADTDLTVEEFARSTAAARMADQIKRVIGGAKARTETRLGPPALTIAETAEELGADLVVIGTHGRTGLSHFLLGSVAERVVRISHVPVLTVRFAERGDEGERTRAEQALEDEQNG